VPTTQISALIEFPFSANPFKSTAKRHFRFCVPDEWYRRSKSRSVSPAPGPSESTLRRLAALQESESEEDVEDESTAKLRARNPPADSDTAKAVEQRGLVTQVRLSNMFGDWLRPSSPTASRNSAVATHENRKSVSEPKLAPVSQIIEKPDSSDVSEDERDGDFDAAFEEMMVIGTPACLKSFFLITSLG
jgi:diaphanous 1